MKTSIIALVFVISLLFTCSNAVSQTSSGFDRIKYAKVFTKGNQSGFVWGETNSVHQDWSEAQNKALEAGLTGQQRAQYTINAISNAFVSGEQYSCIALQVAINTWADKCQALKYAIRVSTPQAGSRKTATGWVDKAAKKFYYGYTDFDSQCSSI